jgi:hypothetical protein
MLNKPPVVFPDMAHWAVDYLVAALAARPAGETFADNVKVATKVPSAMPARLITVRDDGGPRQPTVTKTNGLGVNVWAATEADASDLARLTVALLEASAGNGPIVGHISTSGPYPVVEESTKPHWYASVDLSVRGVPL